MNRRLGYKIGHFFLPNVGPFRKGRFVRPRSNDRWIISYPKSGNTWVRFFLSALKQRSHETDFERIHKDVPDIYKSFSGELDKIPSPRILKSHEPYDPRYRNVLYLVRDPRAVCSSYYRYWRNIETRQSISIEAFCEQFIKGELDNYGTWCQHVESWLNAEESIPELLLIKYEDLIRDPTLHFRKIAKFSKIDFDEAELSKAIEQSSFSLMKQKDEQRGHTFVGKGLEESWREDLPKTVAEELTQTARPLLEKLKYPLI